MGGYDEKKQEKAAERNKTCWLRSQDVGQCIWTVGAAVPREKGQKIVVQGNRSAGYKARTEPDCKGLLGAGTTKQECGGQKNRQMGWRASMGPLTWDLRGALNVKPVVDNMGPKTVAIAGMP